MYPYQLLIDTRCSIARGDFILAMSDLHSIIKYIFFDFLGVDDHEDDFSAKLERIVQLTGFSDPIYAEADINVHQYDITLDIFVANQTSDTLQNLCLELATLGDLKLVERPQNYTLAPYSSKNIKAHIKV